MREATLHDTPIAQPGSPLVPPSPRPATSLRVLKIAPTQFFADYGCHVRILEETLAIRRLGARAAICAYPGGRAPEGLDVRRAWGAPWSNERPALQAHDRLDMRISPRGHRDA